jgi:hypothetical protein
MACLRVHLRVLLSNETDVSLLRNEESVQDSLTCHIYETVMWP